MNHVVLVGRLTKDPELRYIPGSGTPVANFTLAKSASNKLFFNMGLLSRKEYTVPLLSLLLSICIRTYWFTLRGAFFESSFFEPTNVFLNSWISSPVPFR